MDDLRLGAVEGRFAELVWAAAPLSSRELVAICEKELEWKKSTTYTVLKRLCDRGIFRNDGGTVKVVLTREEFFAAQSEKYVEDSFGGSLPAFLAAFTSRKQLSGGEIEELKRIIETMGGR